MMKGKNTEWPTRGVAIAALGVLLAASLAACVMFTAGSARAATFLFEVNRVADTDDGVCNVVQGCSLREAIKAANANPGADFIEFDIPESQDPGVKTISPTSPLPVITDPVTIDGYSQTGATQNTRLVGTDARLLIELDGSNTRSTGLVVRASGVLVRGLVVNDFVFGGISVNNGASNARIEGNFIGTDPSGTQAQGNGGNGVSVLFGGTDNVVGGAPRTAHNLISGNDASGVEIQQSSGNKVFGNLIGTKKDGTTALGNGTSGVAILEAADNTVGSVTFGTANTIAFNGEDGVRVDQFNPSADVSGNGVGFNSIFSNGGLGIDLVGGTENAAGATANDAGDADGGPNGLQNKPRITSATTSSGSTTVRGKLNSTPRGTYLIQVFSSPSGNEGKTFLGQTGVTTDASGNATFSLSTNLAVPAGSTVTATATVAGDTSEFSAPKTATAA